jgi:hypothetical protein
MVQYQERILGFISLEKGITIKYDHLKILKVQNF